MSSQWYFKTKQTKTPKNLKYIIGHLWRRVGSYLLLKTGKQRERLQHVSCFSNMICTLDYHIVNEKFLFMGIFQLLKENDRIRKNHEFGISVNLDQQSTNFCKQSNSKHLRLCGPCRVCCIYSSLQLEYESHHGLYVNRWT